MREEFNNLLSILTENKMEEEKEEILEVFDIAKGSLNSLIKKCKEEGQIAGANLDLERLEEIKKLADSVNSCLNELENFDVYKASSSTSVTIKHEETPKIKIPNFSTISLNENLTKTKPKQYKVDDKVYDVSSWSGLLAGLTIYFSEKDTFKFNNYIKIINSKNNYMNYFADKVSKDDYYKNNVKIRAVNKYYIFHGSAEALGKYVKELLDFFGYQNKVVIYGILNQTQSETVETIEQPKDKNYRLNDYVCHKKYGNGRIIQIDDDAKVAIIKFADEQRKFKFENMTDAFFIP